MVKRIVLGLEYEGTNYYGWQCQDGLNTLQSTVETALSRVANHPVSTICAGRTDAGVHALGQVIHFDSEASRTLDNWIMGGNTHLPDAITIRWAKIVDGTFHARYSALARRYYYVIYNHPTRSSIFRQKTTWWYRPLNEKRMQIAANYLLGEHDFTSFRAINCQAKTTVRTLHQLNVRRQQDFIVIEVKANAFLHHMVRNITGVLMAIGEGKKPPSWAEEVLLACDRKKAGITAPPIGLYLAEVEYPERFGVPRHCIQTYTGIALKNNKAP
jgi:tRNA pseudouridine38-40 synthase